MPLHSHAIEAALRCGKRARESGVLLIFIKEASK
jgi:hypothetical protein